MSCFSESADATARLPTPIFNTPQIPFLSLPLKKDAQNLIREIETIALPKTKFKCLRQVSEFIYEVEAKEYPSSTPLYADVRFLEPATLQTPERQKILPSRQQILDWLKSCVGIRYFWGGNWRQGIPEMLDIYPQLREALSQDREDAICLGVDCSGLLYEATNGSIPRNTSQLISYGRPLSNSEIQTDPQPLDLIVWKGHILIVLSSELLIESRGGKGVIISPFKERFAEAVQLTHQENKTLHFRRWHPDSS